MEDMGEVFPRLAIAALTAIVAGAPAVLATPRSEELRARASNELYNLDRERAVATYREAIAADPEDAAAYRGLAVALWMGETFRRGTMTVDSYLGGVTRANVKLPPPSPELVSEFDAATSRAIAIARKRVAANSRDADAHYQLGAAIGLRASFAATIQGSMRAAFGSARDAYNAHERVLSLDPRRHDAGLIVGSYRYLVAIMALPLRWVAYAAGFGGGRERGLGLVQGAADYAGENRTDARVALVLLYNRERRYDEALRELQRLRAEYPRNRLFWLETGATLLRASRMEEANRVLTEGMGMLAGDDRTRMFGEEAIWYQKRGAARAALGRSAEATDDLRKALSSQGRPWIHGRAHLELGRLALKAGNRPAAQTELKTAITLCEGDNDRAAANEARRLLR
jgi:tetratricopeptide (TPR) repeat protein